MSVRLTAASSQALTRASPFDYNAAYTVLGAFLHTTLPGAGSMTIWGDYFDNNNEDRLMYFFTSNRFIFRTRDTSVDNDIVGTTVPAVLTWYYFACVRSTAADTELFFGLSPSTVASQGTLNHALGAGRTGNAAVTFGIGRNNSVAAFLDGRVRGFRVYTAGLNLAQIKTELASPDVAVLATNLWGSWALSAAGLYTDTSGNGRTLTEVAGPLTSEPDPLNVRRGRRRALAAFLAEAA